MLALAISTCDCKDHHVRRLGMLFLLVMHAEAPRFPLPAATLALFFDSLMLILIQQDFNVVILQPDPAYRYQTLSVSLWIRCQIPVSMEVPNHLL